MELEAVAITGMWLITGLLAVALRREGVPAWITIGLASPGIALFVAGLWATNLGYRPQDFFAHGLLLWLFIILASTFFVPAKRRK